MEYEGIVGLSRTLEKFAQGLDPFMREAMREIEQRVYHHSRDLAPIRTGRLQSKIYTRGHGLYFVLGCRVPYAKFQELGWKYGAAQPFLAPAIENYWHEIYAIISKNLDNLWRMLPSG